MKTFPRRALSTVLAAALFLGAVPPGAQAQVVRVTVGETGSMPVSPVGGSVAGPALAPSLSIGAASLNASLSAPSAPTPAATRALAVAAAATPASFTPAGSAASEDAPKLPDAPKAATPVQKTTWRDRLAALIGRKPATTPAPQAEAPAAPTAEAAKTGADKTFDGAAEKTGDVDAAAPVAGADSATRLSGLKASVAARVAVSKAKRDATVDEFGGPLAEPMTFKQRVGFGLRSGLNLVGIGFLLNLTLRPFLNLFPWPQYLSDTTLHGFGRIALLTKFGPDAIVSGLANSPGTFLGVSLPMAVAMEEITYRLFGFGLTFLMIAAIKPLTRRIATMIDGLPDAAGAVTGAKKLLRLGEWFAGLAFPIAAVMSSMKFAAAHFAAWGVSPYVMGLNLILGLFLASTAYKSRSLTSPVLAHLVFNLVTIGAILVAMSFSPLAGAAFSLIAGMLGVASLVHAWLTTRKEMKWRLSNPGKAFVASMLILATLGAIQPRLSSPPRDAAAVAIQTIQDKRTETAPIAKVADTAATSSAIESREDMVARVKPSVVNVIVHMPGGYAIGSGFILTPDGKFVTNGHVVGDKQPGDIINAKVPGIDGELKAKVLAVNHDKDLAIVQLQPRPDGKPWPTVKLSQTAPREGEEVTAIGYPRGLPFTVSKGVVSGLDGRGTMYVRKLQTDAAINPGNSGGPLFNTRGEVIGVNTEIATQSGGSEGLGFSIQVPEVAHILDQFAKTGNIATASLGIIANLSDPQAPAAGLEIEYVRHGSAAEKAGLKRGDLLISVGDQTIGEGGQQAAGHIAAVLSKMIPGQKTTVTVLRGDQPIEIEITVDAKATVAPSH